MSRIFNKTPFQSPGPATGTAVHNGMGTPTTSVTWGSNDSANNKGGTSLPIYVEGHSFINWYFVLTGKDGNPTHLNVIPEVAELMNPAPDPAMDESMSPANWSILQQVQPTYVAPSGLQPPRAVMEHFDYVIVKAGIDLIGAAPPTGWPNWNTPGQGLYSDFPNRFLAVSIPVSGFRWMRIHVCCKSTAPAGNDLVTGYARYTLSGGPV